MSKTQLIRLFSYACIFAFAGGFLFLGTQVNARYENQSGREVAEATRETGGSEGIAEQFESGAPASELAEAHREAGTDERLSEQPPPPKSPKRIERLDPAKPLQNAPRAGPLPPSTPKPSVKQVMRRVNLLNKRRTMARIQTRVQRMSELAHAAGMGTECVTNPRTAITARTTSTVDHHFPTQATTDSPVGGMVMGPAMSPCCAAQGQII